MRTLIVGDVHGCRRELQDLLDKFRFRPSADRLFQVGDLIGRGPDSLGALDLVESLGGLCVKGNHEAKLLKIWDIEEAQRMEKDQAMLRCLKNPERIVQSIRSWPLWREVSGKGEVTRYLIVHAGLEPGKVLLEEMSERSLLNIRTWDGVGRNLECDTDPPWWDCVSWSKMPQLPKMIVFGHWARRGLTIEPNVRGLDSGCVYGKSLSGWCPEEDRIYQVPARLPPLPAD